jgi:hypothetical protein
MTFRSLSLRPNASAPFDRRFSETAIVVAKQRVGGFGVPYDFTLHGGCYWRETTLHKYATSKY